MKFIILLNFVITHKLDLNEYSNEEVLDLGYL